MTSKKINAGKKSLREIMDVIGPYIKPPQLPIEPKPGKWRLEDEEWHPIPKRRKDGRRNKKS